MEARFVIQEGGELQRVGLVELGVKRVAVNELRVWPFDPDLNRRSHTDPVPALRKANPVAIAAFKTNIFTG